MGISYLETKNIAPEQLSRLFENSGINRPYQDLDRLERMIANANLIITAWEEDRLVGIARALTDYAYCCYLSDLAVDENYHKMGIGTELVERVKARIGEEASLILLSAPSAMEYYPKIGFSQTDRGFVIVRSK